MLKTRKFPPSRLLTAHFPGKQPRFRVLLSLLTTYRSEQLLEDEGTSVAPPQRLRSHTAVSQTQPLPGSSQQRVENRTNVDNDIESDDESGSNETDGQSNSEDGKASKDGNANSDDGKASKDGSVNGYVFPLSCPLEGFFFYFYVISFHFNIIPLSEGFFFFGFVH